jgi:hypothetical protein
MDTTESIRTTETYYSGNIVKKMLKEKFPYSTSLCCILFKVVLGSLAILIQYFAPSQLSDFKSFYIG